jgi:hypothetical protein
VEDEDVVVALEGLGEGTKLDLVPNRPVLTRAHSGCPVRSSR